MSDATQSNVQSAKWKDHLLDASKAALENLDRFQRYTVGSDPSLSFKCGVRDEFPESNSTGQKRHTALMTLIVKGPKAAAFLFRSSGLNLQKLEKLLEGVLIGLAAGSNPNIPRRLRIDTEILEIGDHSFPKRLQDPEVIAVPYSDVAGKAFTLGSVIDRALKPDKPLIVWCESETIGPSVQYAYAADGVADYLAEEKRKTPKHRADRSLEILDLFSGSGYCARRLAEHDKRWLVYCVDNTVGPREAVVREIENIIWLKMDASRVGNDRLLDQSFDLVCADPPHSNLFEIAFCEQNQIGRLQRQAGLLKTIKEITDWFVLYPGHHSQAGRARALCRAIAAGGWRTGLVKMEPEVVIIASKCEDFDRAMIEIVQRIRKNCADDGFNWVIEASLGAAAEYGFQS
jgi:hypothetical protein